VELIDINVAPGILREDTERGAVGRWYDCDKVRFREGLPEKLGGWIDYESTNAIIPGSLTVDDITGVNVTLSWTPATGESSITAQLQRRLAPSGAWADVAGATASPFVDMGLAQETQYDWRVKYTFGEVIVYSNIVRAITEDIPLIAGVLTAGTPTNTEVELTWTDATGGEGAITAQLERSLGGANTWSDVMGATTSPFTDTGLDPGTAYDYRIRFEDDAETVYSNTVEVNTDIGIGQSMTWTTFSPSTYLIISDGNRRATRTTSSNSGGWAKASYADGFKSSGKWYFEILCVNSDPSRSFSIGIAASTTTNRDSFSQGGSSNAGDGDRFQYFGSGEKRASGVYNGYGDSFASGDRIGISLDFDDGMVLRGYKNGVDQGVMYSGLSAGVSYCPHFCCYNQPREIFIPEEIMYLPEGFLPWT